MKTILTLTLVALQAYSHNIDRHRCQYYENPRFVALYDNSIKPQPQRYCLANRNAPDDDALGYFPGQDVEPRPEDLMRSFNMGYLNVEEPLESIGDLVSLNSDEIGVLEPPKLEDPTKLWKTDEMSSLTGPKLLPDVVIGSERPEEGVASDVLDEREIKLGRTLVEDVPYVSDPMPVEQSLRKEVEDMGDVEFGEKYLEEPARSPPRSIVLDKVVQRDEKVPDFMEQLEEIKQVTMPNAETFEELLKEVQDEEDASEPTPLAEISSSPSAEVSTSSPVTESPTTSKPMTENTIEKAIIAENLDLAAEPKTVSTKRRSKKSKRKNKTTTENVEAQELKTPSRFSDSNNTLLDGLLTVL